MADNNSAPPPEIEEAARKVDAWLKSQPPIVGSQQPQQRPETAAERFARTIRSDTPPLMPAWKNPRSG
jgi:hypothetical protein